MNTPQSSKVCVIRYKQFSPAHRWTLGLGFAALAICFGLGAFFRFTAAHEVPWALLTLTALSVAVALYGRRRSALVIDHGRSELRLVKRRFLAMPDVSVAALSGAVRSVASAIADARGYHHPVTIFVEDDSWMLDARFSQEEADSMVRQIEDALLAWRQAAAVASVRAPKARKAKRRRAAGRAPGDTHQTPAPAMFRIEASDQTTTVRWRRGLSDLNPAGVFGLFVLGCTLLFLLGPWALLVTIPLTLYFILARLINRYELKMGKELITLRSGPLPPHDKSVEIVTSDVEGAYSEAVGHTGSVVNHSVFVRMASGANRVVCRGLPPDAADWLQESIEGLVAARRMS